MAGPEDVVVRVARAGTCGSDLHAFEHGTFISPGQVMGHEFSGDVVEVGADVVDVSVGDRVTAVPLGMCGRCARCAEGNSHLCVQGLSQAIAYSKELPGAFAEYVRIPKAAVGRNLYRLPDPVDDAAVALVEPMAVACHSVRAALPGPSDTCVVTGLGSIGLNAVQMLRASGAGRIVGIDISPLRLQMATELGAEIVVDGRHEDPVAALQAVTGADPAGSGAQADVVLETSGVPDLLAAAVRMTRPGGRLRVVALYGGPVTLDATMIVSKELDISGSFGYRNEFGPVLSLLEQGRLRSAPLITHTYPLSDITAAFRTQLDKDSAIKVQLAS
ncbi:zinc-binding dehydrogenase [Streptomyces sp. Y7]|uniref:zinc-dependent alcohol dehydrogenase n=1 Tax=Streptomyces sp. Y7 TaxID=3342392 RepID=UPI003722154D